VRGGSGPAAYSEICHITVSISGFCCSALACESRGKEPIDPSLPVRKRFGGVLRTVSTPTKSQPTCCEDYASPHFFQPVSAWSTSTTSCRTSPLHHPEGGRFTELVRAGLLLRGSLELWRPQPHAFAIPDHETAHLGRASAAQNPFISAGLSAMLNLALKTG
jgi:hypothetical protein